MTEALSAEERRRYARHLQLPEVGVEGQLALKNARVLVVGAGGLGAPVTLYLAAAGVGRLTLVDGDRVEVSNLQRQVLYTSDDIGRPKVETAAARLGALNPEIEVATVREHLGLDNADRLVAAHDLVLDCTDNFATRYLINDFTLKHRKPWLFAAVNRFQGCLALFDGSEGSACFRCLYPEPPTQGENCNTGGILGVVPGMLALAQASEALRFLLGLATRSAGHLVLMDTGMLETRAIRIGADPQCLCRHKDIDPHKSLKSMELPVSCDAESDLILNWSNWQRRCDDHGGLLVDVRTEEEHRRANRGGINLPLSEAEARLLEEPADRFVGLYCQSGRRSAQLARKLREAGMTAVYSLEGGVEG